MSLRVGTSGFSYEDWVGHVYPPTIKKSQWFDYYAQYFDTLEINSSFYRIPSPHAIKSLCERAPGGFLFSLKAYQEITHKGDITYLKPFLRVAEIVTTWNKGLWILFQFPYSFHKTPENMEYLKQIARETPLPKAVELRHPAWFDQDLPHWAEELGLTVVSVDSPFLKEVVPGKSVYMRMHGRNAEKWWQHEEAHERYDYLYNEEELADVARRLKSTNADAYLVYFNNHFQGKAFRNAQMFLSLWNTD
ncbi:DUF72 domain-containing protein [Coprothermobacteraceae bacterium]|nr:DUF72 domain-containing protein [Coprothermobacteraceae bacterium]